MPSYVPDCVHVRKIAEARIRQLCVLAGRFQSSANARFVTVTITQFQNKCFSCFENRAIILTSREFLIRRLQDATNYFLLQQIPLYILCIVILCSTTSVCLSVQALFVLETRTKSSRFTGLKFVSAEVLLNLNHAFLSKRIVLRYFK